MSFAAVTGRAVRWGVMGTGTIAHDFVAAAGATELRSPPSARGRTKEQLDGDAHNIMKAGSHEASRDDSLDIVYVATPSIAIRTCCCAKVGAVLCRRPWRPSAQEAKKVVDKAVAEDRSSRAGRSRFFPAMVRSAKHSRAGHRDVYAAHASSARTTARAKLPPRSRRVFIVLNFSVAFDGTRRSWEGVSYSLAESV